MKRKFISVMLLSALMAASTGTFVSCHDYDDEITELRDAIKANKTELATTLDEKLETADKELTSLKSQADALDEAYKLADEVLQNTLQESISQAQGTLQEGVNQAESKAKAYADIQAAEAEKAAIEAARQMVNEAVASLEASIKAANESIKAANDQIAAQGNSIQALIEADGELSKGIASAQARADEAYDLADRANKLAASVDAKADENAESIKKLQDALSALTTNIAEVQKNLDEKTDLINGQVSDLYDKAEKQAATISSLETQLKSLRESNDDAIKTFQGKDAELLKMIEDNNKAIKEQLSTEVKDLKAQAEENLKTAKAYTDAEILTVSKEISAIKSDIDGVKGDVSSINVTIAEMQEAYKKADKALEDKIGELKSDVEEQLATLKANQTETDKAQDAKIKALEEQLATLKTDQANTDKAQDEKVKELEEQLKTLKDDQSAANKKIQDLEDLLKAIEGGNLEAFAQKVKGMGDDISTLQGNVKDINANITFLGKRLKSLVFAPTTYVDGIECMWFATLNYYNWGTNAADWEKDAATENENNYVVIDDAEHTEEYLVNPKHVQKDDIKSLSFISKQAMNTRAISTDAPIEISQNGDDWDVNKGVLKLNAAKKKTLPLGTTFGTNKNQFTIVALKATLDEKVFTDEEKKNGAEVEVYSDWARLYETSERPYIHNKLAKVEGNADSHFWNYSTVYDGKTKDKMLGNEFNTLHIAKEVHYKDDVDLLEYVEVCDKKGNPYDAAKYGLKFFFNVMDYNLQNNEGLDATNQKNFAKFTDANAPDHHKLVSTARNGEMNNRDAIGRQPMIQVVLKDMNHNKVVDVRYFKIKWIDKIDPISISQPLVKTTQTYKCDDDHRATINEEMMNMIYTKVGMSRDEFHNKYRLNQTLFDKEDDVMNGTGTPNEKLGRIEDKSDATQAGQTHNMEWIVNTEKNPGSKTEYGKEKNIKAWGFFQDKVNPMGRVVFCLEMTLKIESMKYAHDKIKEGGMWNEALTTRFVNPQLDTDENYGTSAKYVTSMIVGDFLKGYKNEDGKTPSHIEDLVNFCDEAKFVFDEENLNNLPQASGKWDIISDGLTLTYNDKPAAVINGKDIQLVETANGKKGSEASEGAKLLVGQNIPVKLVSSWCVWENKTIESYNINITKPLNIDVKEKYEVEVMDVIAGGSKSKTFDGTINVKEAYKDGRPVWNNNKPENNPANNEVLKEWYGFKTPEYLLDNATIQIGKDKAVLLNSIKNTDGTQKYRITIEGTGADTKAVYYNQSGNRIGQELKITIPVKVTTKWQEERGSIVVTVKPNI